jgi:hypothetical protein
MTPLSLFVHTLAAFGLAYVVGHSVITRSLREWIAGDESSRMRFYVITLLECPACLGFWMGLAYALAFEYHPLLAALYVCGTNFIIGRATGLVRHPEEA